MVLFEVVVAVLFVIMANSRSVKSRVFGGMGDGNLGNRMGKDKKGVG